MVNGQYSEANFEGSRGSLQSDGASVWIDHHAGVHGYHKYIATSDQYKGGILESSWGAGAATTAQPGHSSPPSHTSLDARSFAGDYFTCFPCFPLVPFACEKIIPHGWHDYQSKGWMVMLVPVPYPIPIPLCWDLHLVRLAGNTFAVDTPGCDKGTKQTWTSADGFQGSNRCCPTGRS